MTVRKLEEREFDDWTRLVSSSPDGSIFSLPSYLKILSRAAGGRFSVFGEWNGDELLGGAAVHEVDSRYGVQVSPAISFYITASSSADILRSTHRSRRQGS
jgi:hypothetical protein